MMFSRVARRGLWALALLVVGCSAEESLIVPGLEAPTTLTATPLNMSGIRLDWTPGQFADLDRYRIERRVDFRGRFDFVAEVGPADKVYFDTELEAETFYGYRIVAINREGQRSEASTVAGARTAPRPGLHVETGLGGGTDPGVADPNGYRIIVTGARDTTFEIGTIDAVTIAPLPPGDYSLTLQDIISTCSVSGGTSRQVSVVDTGLATRAGVTFTTSCSDPTRGTVVAEVTVTGDSVDADGYLVRYDGIIPGDTLPVSGGSSLGGLGGFASFASLRPGDYQLALTDVEAPCTIDGSATADIDVHPLSIDTVRFAVTCPDKGGGSPDAPLVVRQQWNPQTAANGQTVDLEVAVDLSGLAGKSVGALQANFRFDPAVLTYQSTTTPPGSLFSPPTVNTSVPGTITWVTISAAPSQPQAVLPVATFRFRVAGAAGATSATHSQIELVADLSGTEDLLPLFRVEEDTFAVSGGGSSNQSPTAEAGGPYSGATGSPISFSSTGSTDPDGTIASYSWVFGDGGTSTSQNPTHTYASSGSFTATLTVTDNSGGQATDQATVTVTGGGGGNQPPVANAGGPYSGTPGTPVSFSSAGSSDPDGSIASYSWTFGDGGSSTSQNPTHTYAAAGSFTAGLTVTDNLGATASSQASVTITGGGSGGPLTWTSTFGGFEQVLGTYPLSITLNLGTDIPETTGPEALGSFAVDSIVWNPAVLEYHSLAFGSGGGSFNTTNATGGCKCKLVFNGSPTVNTGLVTIATVRFKPVGAPGTSSTTVTGLGAILSTAPLGSFNYKSKITVVEGTVTLP